MSSAARTHSRWDAEEPDDQINVIDNRDLFEILYCREDDEIGDSKVLVEDLQSPAPPNPKPILKHTPNLGDELAPQTDREYIQDMENTKPKRKIFWKFVFGLVLMGMAYFLHRVSEIFLS